ncbi:hypothetical protein UlMin_010995 [Ulmus minor]
MAAASASKPSSCTINRTGNSPSEERTFLSRASHLSRKEVLRRRSNHLRKLTKCYRDLYWAYAEELRIQYNRYYWNYGVSPFKQDQPQPHLNLNQQSDENNPTNCSFVGCDFKAMPLTTFCHLHILSDSNQKLYKPCTYVIKSAQAGPITCGKPILRSAAPSLCSAHFQKAQKHVTRALKKAGLNVSSSSKLAPKFHVIVAETVKHIQTKRRAVQKPNINKVVIKEESCN